MVKKVLLITVLCYLGLSIQAAKKEVKIDSLWYELNTATNSQTNEETCTARVLPSRDNGILYKDNITIPAEISYEGKTYSVTAINGGAFKDCFQLSSISLPASVIDFGKEAFSGCVGLNNVTYPSINYLYSVKYGNEKSNPLTYTKHLVINDQEITTLNINQDVQDYAFYGAKWLTKITFNDGTDSIGKAAFSECEAITEIVFSRSLKKFKIDAFKNDTSLNNVTYASEEQLLNIQYANDKANPLSYAKHLIINGSEVTTLTINQNIQDYAFCGASWLTKVSIGSNVKTIGKDAFKNCTELNNVIYTSEAQLLSMRYANEKSNPLSYAKHLIINGSEVTSVNINCDVNNYAFCEASWLKEVTFTNDVTSIGKRAFYNCTSITSIDLPSSVVNIDDLAFHGCKFTSIRLGATCQIGKCIFQECRQLETVVLPTNMTSIPEALFDKCYKLKNITLPENVTTIGKWAFRSCESITELPYNEKIDTIGEEAFRNCKRLTVITLPKTIKSISINAFADCEKMTEIYCHALNVPTVADNSFGILPPRLKLYVREELISDYQTTDPWKAFSFIDAIRTSQIIYYVNDKEYYKITATGGTLVDNSGLVNPTPGIFSGWDKEIPTYMPNDTLCIYGYRSDILTVDEKFIYYLHPEERLNGKNLDRSAEFHEVIINAVQNDKAIVLPSEISYNDHEYPVRVISDQAFMGLSLLESVTLPNTITKMGTNVFKGCTNLINVTLPNQLTSLPAGTFDGCYNLTYVSLPEDCTTIEKCAFKGCNKLSAIPNADKLQNIGNEAFKACSSLTSIVLPDDCQLGTDVFQECRKLESVELPTNLTIIPKALFDKCNKLKNITLPEGVTCIEKYAFRNCESLTILPTSEKLTIIGEEAFKSCKGLTVITLPANLLSIEAHAFDNCVNLTEVYSLAVNAPSASETAFGTSVSSMKLYVSKNCIPNYNTVVPWNSFSKITEIKDSKLKFYINDAQTLIIKQRGGTVVDYTNLHKPDDGIFSDWDKELPYFMPNDSVDFYGYVTNILTVDGIRYYLRPSEKLNGKNLEKRAELIKIVRTLTADDTLIDIAKKITYNEADYPVVAIGDSAFIGQTTIQRINIPESINSIGKLAFKGCSGITSITLPYAVHELSTSVFENCTSLASITLSDELTVIGKNAFYNCRSLTELPVSSKLEEIGENAFRNCSGLKLLMMIDQTQLKYIRKEAFRSCSNISAITLPASLTTIEQWAFASCNNLQDVFIFANTAPTADATAFGDMQSAMRLYVPKGKLASYQEQEPWKNFSELNENGEFTLSFYVNDAFHYKTKQYGGTLIDQSLIPEVKNGIFSGWDKEIPAVMPGHDLDIYGYVSQEAKIGDFNYNLLPAEQLNGKNLEKRAVLLSIAKKLTQNDVKLQVPETVNYLNEDYPVQIIAANAFLDCNYLERIILPTTINEIGNAAFKGCTNLKTVSNFPTTLETIADELFFNCKALSLFQLSEKVKSIGRSAFLGCANLKSLPLPQGLKTLGYQAFANSGLEQITLPASLTTMGDEVFKQCRNLQTVTFTPGFVLALPKLTFNTCQSLTKVTLQGTMVEISENAFLGCNKLSNLVIPEGILTIDKTAFKNCSSLANITLPSTLDMIGRECFAGCTALEQITIINPQAPSANIDAFEQVVYNTACLHVPNIEAYQDEPWKFFKNKYNESAYTITYIVDGQKYKEVEYLVGRPIIPEQAPINEGHLFSGWIDLPEIMPAHALNTNGNFQYSVKFYENEVNENNRLLGSDSFVYYYGEHFTLPLEELKRPNCWLSIYGINENPLGEEEAQDFDQPMPSHDINAIVVYHKSEEEVVLNGITYKILVLKKNVEVVSAANTIVEAVIPDYITYEGENYPVEVIRANAFKDCAKLTTIVLPTHLLSIGNQAFYNCSQLSSIFLPSELQSIGMQAFSKTAIIDIEIPISIVDMDKEVFLWCTKLKDVTFNASICSVPNRTFKNCLSLTNITLPKQLTTIEEYAFESCINLPSIALSEQVTTIEEGAFKDCYNVEQITLPASVENIGDKAFINTIGEGDVITLMGTSLPDALKSSFDDTAYNKAMLRTKVLALTGPCWPYFKNVRYINPDGIESVHADKDLEAPIYDLNGRMVGKAQSSKLKDQNSKGIYIQNGKKIYVK